MHAKCLRIHRSENRTAEASGLTLRCGELLNALNHFWQALRYRNRTRYRCGIPLRCIVFRFSQCPSTKGN